MPALITMAGCAQRNHGSCLISRRQGRSCSGPIDTPFGTVYPDCLWPEARLVGECDGAIKYADAKAYVNEKEREQVLRDLDFGIVRWLAKEIMLDPQRVVGRVERELRSRQPQ